MSHPLLYSFRRCPYAMRARMALVFYNQQVVVREISLKAKPAIFLETSPKGTVPVLLLPNGNVIDESLDVMVWAASESGESVIDLTKNALVIENDSSFASSLRQYKYFERYPEKTQDDYFKECQVFLAKLDNFLIQNTFLSGDTASLLDIAIFPLVRQCKKVDEQRFDALSFDALKRWTKHWLDSSCLEKAMHKYPLWDEQSEPHFLLNGIGGLDV